MTEPRHYEYVCDSGTAKRFSRVLNRWARVTAYAGLVLGACGLLLAMVAGGWPPAIVITMCSAGLLWQSGPRHFPSVAQGRSLSARFGHSEVEFASQRSTVRVPYASFTKLDVRGGVTLYRVRGSRGRCGVPVEIFPPDEIARVKAIAGI